MKLEFSLQILKKKNAEISNVMKIRSVGAELCYADGQTWRNWLSLFAILEMRLKAKLKLFTDYGGNK